MWIKEGGETGVGLEEAVIILINVKVENNILSKGSRY
jgi:hypothetical protein